MDVPEKMGYRIQDLNEAERPRERLERLGAEALKDAELLAILLRTGLQGENAVQVGERLLHTFGGLSGIHKAAFEVLCRQRGLGKAKAAQLKAALEIGNRLMKDDQGKPRSIHSPEDAAAMVCYQMMALEQEELWVLLLNTRNQVIKIEKIYRGSANQSQVRVAEIFKTAVRLAATRLIVVHNHPSGDPTPSPDDVAVTRAIIDAGRTLDIEVLDHIVIGGTKHFSLKENGLAFRS